MTEISESTPATIRSGMLRWAVPFGILCWLLSLDFHFPISASTLDESWQRVLADAVVEERRFGSDFIYTYGPLGHYLAYTTHEDTLAKKIAWEITTKALAVVLLIGMAAGLSPAYRWILLGWSLIACLVSMEAFVLASVFHALVLSYLAFHTDKRGAERWRRQLIPWLLIPFLAAMALAKFTLLVVIFASMVFISLTLLSRGRWKTAIAYPAISLIVVLSLWKGIGQSSREFVTFLQGSSAISSGFAETMGLAAAPGMELLGGFAVVLTIAWVLLALFHRGLSGREWIQRLLPVAIPGCFGYVAWKHGFVRADSHVLIFFAFLPFLYLGLSRILLPIPSWKPAWEGLGATAIVVSVAGLLLGRPDFSELPLQQLERNLTTLAASGDTIEDLRREQRREDRRNALPRIQETVQRAKVDAFGDRQGYVLANRLKYRPRPIFQSFSAYNETLIDWNAPYFGSSDRPEFVLTEIFPIDGRFPSLADSKVLHALLTTYAPRFREGPFLLLEASDEFPIDPETGSLAHTISGRLGEPLEIPPLPENTLWWAEIDAAPSLSGRIRSFVHRPQSLRLTVEAPLPEGVNREYRFEPAFGKAGFWLSPLLLTTHDLTRFYRGEDLPSPTAITISPENSKGSGAFRDSITLRLFAAPLPATSRAWSGPDADQALYFELGAVPESGETLGVGFVKDTQVALVSVPGSLEFSVPSEATRLSGSFGMTAESFIGEERSDGAVFRVLHRNAEDDSATVLLERTLSPNRFPADREIQSFQLDLPTAGSGSILLEADPGPAGESTADTAGWGELEFE